MKSLIVGTLLCLSISVQAQKIFSESEFIAVVKKFHPLSRQAALDVRIAEAILTESRGAFDPVATMENSRKHFDGIRYYELQRSELKIPTWYGIDVYAGSETLAGDRLNPESTRGTVHYLGFSVPLVQNLIIDRRRAAVQQSKILKDRSEAVLRAAINDLIAEALLAYWDWWEQQEVLQVVQASVQNAKARLAMVQTAHRLGERPAIDTLEAATQVQLLEQQQAEAFMQLQKGRWQLSLFLWTENGTGYQLPADAVPQGPQLHPPPMLDSLLAEAKVQPSLLALNYQLKNLGIDKRIRFQSLLPEIRARYQTLTRDFPGTFDAAFLPGNNRFGFSISMPLRLSEGRGAYRAAQLKIEQARVAQVAEQASVQIRVQQYYMEWEQTKVQFRQQQQLVRNYHALQRGEEMKFANGESSLFLINAREAKTIDEKRKELTLAAKIQKTAVRLRWAAGVFSNY